MDLKLPEIVPARVVPSAADAIDRAGAKFKQAADDVGDVLLKQDMAQVAVETQEATLQSVRGLNDILHLAKSSPEMPIERVRDIFGGNIPESIATTEERTTSGGSTVTAEREIIPTHEIVTALFEQQSKVVVDNAAANIKAPGWQKKFREAAAVDVERARAEALDWQRTQRAADIELRTLAQLQQAENARAWDFYESILSNGDLTLRVGLRAQLLSELPVKKALAQAGDRLQSSDPAEMDKLVADINGSKLGAPLSTEQRFTLTNRARDRKNEILAEQARAAKAAKEAKFQAEVDEIQKAEADAIRTGGVTGEGYSVARIPLDMDDAEYRTLKAMIEADPARLDDPRTVMGVAEMLKTEGLLGRQSAQWIYGLKPKFSQKKWEKLLDDWTKDKVTPGAAKPPLPEFVSSKLGDAVAYAMGGADKAREQSQEALGLEARLYDAAAAAFARGEKLPPTTLNAMATSLRNGRPVGFFSGGVKVPPKAAAVINYRLKAQATDARVVADYQAAKAMRDEVETAWEAVMGEGADIPVFDDGALMEVYYRVTANREDLAVKIPKGRPVDEKNLIHQAVLEMAPESTAPARAQREKEAERVAGNRQLKEYAARVERRAADLLENPPAELKMQFDAIDRKLQEGVRYSWEAAPSGLEEKLEAARAYARKER